MTDREWIRDKIDDFIQRMSDINDRTVEGWVGGCNSFIKQNLGEKASADFLNVCQGPVYQFAVDARHFLQNLKRQV